MSDRLYHVAGVSLLVVCCGMAVAHAVPAGSGPGDETAATGPATSLTPPPGSALRAAILDALRAEVKRRHGLDVEFVVRDLKAKDGWAWVHVLPQTRDGASQLEDVSALLQLRDGAWAVVEVPCSEVENPDCLDGPEYFHRLMERFPGIPPEILPAPA